MKIVVLCDRWREKEIPTDIIFDKIGKAKTLEIYIAAGDERKLIFEKAVEEIMTEYNCSIRFNIERVDMERSNMLIQGWAFDSKDGSRR